MQLYKPFPSTAKHKKYSVYVKKGDSTKLIHFGDTRYGQFKDKLGHYSHLDHGDPQRRANYLARAKAIRGKDGTLTHKDKNSANYYSVNFLG